MEGLILTCTTCSNAVWGDESGAPDDAPNAELSNGKI